MDKRKKQAAEEATMEPKNMNHANPENIYSDVLGSYTGVTEDFEKPIQDADDL